MLVYQRIMQKVTPQHRPPVRWHGEELSLFERLSIPKDGRCYFHALVAAEHGYARWQGCTVAHQIELAKGKPEACGQHLSDAR